MIKNDPIIAHDSLNDHNKINFQINISNLLNILKLANIILSIGYFIGFFFVIVSEISTIGQKWIVNPIKESMTEDEFQNWS